MKNWGLNVAGLALAGAVAFTAAPAYADGLHSRERYRDSYESYSSWAGFYVGGFAGFAHSWADVTRDGVDWASYSATDVTAGAIFGYNFQNGHSVYGVDSSIGFIGNGGADLEIRGRYGVASNNWLYYGAVGVAFGGSTEYSTPYGSVSASDTAFLLGAGAETKIAPNLNLGLEGQFYLTGDESYDIAGHHYEVSGDTFVLRGRLTWQFGH